MTPNTDQPFELEAARADLLHAVEIVAGTMGRKPSGASLQFEDGWLYIESGPGIAKAPARGTWPLTIVVGASWESAREKSIRHGDPLTLHL